MALSLLSGFIQDSILGGFLGSSVIKNLPAKQKTRVRSLGWEDPLEKEMEDLQEGRPTIPFRTNTQKICPFHYQRNANQNHYEVPFHASQNGCDPKVYKQ